MDGHWPLPLLVESRARYVDVFLTLSTVQGMAHYCAGVKKVLEGPHSPELGIIKQRRLCDSHSRQPERPIQAVSVSPVVVFAPTQHPPSIHTKRGMGHP